MANRREFLSRTAGAATAMVAQSIVAQNPSRAEKPATPKSRPRFSLALASYTFRQFPLDRCLAMTRRVGLRHICLKDFHLPLTSTPDQIAQVAARVKAAGLDLYGCGVVAMRKPAEIDRAFDYAKAAGIRTIICIPTVEMLPRLDERVRKFDIRAAIHNHGPDDKTFPTPDVIYDKIKHLDPRVGLCMDIGHTIRAGVDPARAAQQYADRLLDIHMRDVTSATAAGVCIEIGRGVIDIPEFLRTLIRTGYSGMVSFEFDKDPADPLPGLAESVGYVRGVLAG
ncbi:MAG: sugar phosphate isomerase/epimerase [Thermoguttaceae bacterium]